MAFRNIVGVVTTPFFGLVNEGVRIALMELLELGLGRVLLIYDVKGSSRALAVSAFNECKAGFDAAGVVLEILAVDEDDTTLRWREGVIKALEDPAVEAVFVFPGDCTRPPTQQSREGWRAMLHRAGRKKLVLGDCAASPGSFKDEFENLVGRAAVEAFFPREAAALDATGLRRFRSEVFVLGREVFVRVRSVGTIWTFDPTIDLTLACLRSSDFAVEKVDIDFEDEPGHRNPIGTLAQLTRFVSMMALNSIRLESVSTDPKEQAATYDVLTDRLKAGLRALFRSIERNRPKRPDPEDKYERWRAELSKLSGITECSVLDRLLPGRQKYDHATLKPLPFPGVSVIHNLDPATADRIGFRTLVERFQRALEDARVHDKIALVHSSSVHATTFDLLNQPEHGEALRAGNHDYQTVRAEVQKAANEWLAANGLELEARVKIVGIGMFAPAVVKLDLQFSPVVAEVFQGFRLALHKRLSDVPGYSCVRPPSWDRKLSAHLTVGYVVKPFDATEIEAFLRVLRSFNDGFAAIAFDLTQGEVTAFSDMDHYSPVPSRDESIVANQCGGTSCQIDVRAGRAHGQAPPNRYWFWTNRDQFDAQTRLLKELYAAVERARSVGDTTDISFVTLGDRQRSSGIGCVYKAGLRIDHLFCIGSESTGLLHSALPTDYAKAIRPALHTHHDEMIVCTHGTVAIEYSTDASTSLLTRTLTPGEHLLIERRWPHKIALGPLRNAIASAPSPSSASAGFLAVKMGLLSDKSVGEDLSKWESAHPLIDRWHDDRRFLLELAGNRPLCESLWIDPAEWERVLGA